MSVCVSARLCTPKLRSIADVPLPLAPPSGQSVPLGPLSPPLLSDPAAQPKNRASPQTETNQRNNTAQNMVLIAKAGPGQVITFFEGGGQGPAQMHFTGLSIRAPDCC